MTNLGSLEFPPFSAVQKDSHVKSMEQYQTMYRQSIDEPEKFWLEVAKQFYWSKFPSEENALKYNFDIRKGPIEISWFSDGQTNICYNVLDRIVEEYGDKRVALHWVGNDPQDVKDVTYAQLLVDVCKFANVLKSFNVQRGDRVAIYMPMIPELVVAMLACARIGAVHNIVFGGFSANSLADRILDAEAKILITADGAFRATKLIALKSISDEAMDICSERGHPLSKCICVRHINAKPSSCNGDVNVDTPGRRPFKAVPNSWQPERDCWWHEVMANCSDEKCPVEWMSAEAPLFMLYTSGSTGKPKGVKHSIGGYMIYVATTFKYVFDYQPEDIYWCTADIGWITGHSYVVYGPMANGATQVMFEGIPVYPDAGRCWDIVDKYAVTKFYTAPTAIRALMKSGDAFVKKYNRSSLKILGTVGEPINPEAWMWYFNVVGESRCAVVDTYWQTETGGHVLTPLPGATTCKPGSATFPFFGICPSLLTEEGELVTEADKEGYLVFDKPWPGMMRTVHNNHQRFQDTYFSKFPGHFTTGDGTKRDADGFYWITGRIDDMLNVSGHLMSTAQVESVLVEHPWVAEAAVVGKRHEIKGECLYCFVTIKDGASFGPDLEVELRNAIRVKIGALATPDFIQEAPGLPKTRSGKIMRRLLRAVAEGQRDFGDISTLADPGVMADLFERRPKALQ